METLLESMIITLILIIILSVIFKYFQNKIFKTINYIIISLCILIPTYIVLHSIMINHVTTEEESWKKYEIMTCNNNDSIFKFFMDDYNYNLLIKNENGKFENIKIPIKQLNILPITGQPYLSKKIIIKHINKSKKPEYFWFPKNEIEITTSSFCGCGDEFILYVNKYDIEKIKYRH